MLSLRGSHQSALLQIVSKKPTLSGEAGDPGGAGVLWPLRYPSPGYRVRISETFRSAHPKTSARNEFNLLHILDFRRGSGRSDDQCVGVIAAASEGYFAFASIFSIRVQPSDQPICCVP